MAGVPASAAATLQSLEIMASTTTVSRNVMFSHARLQIFRALHPGRNAVFCDCSDSPSREHQRNSHVLSIAQCMQYAVQVGCGPHVRNHTGGAMMGLAGAHTTIETRLHHRAKLPLS
eukprot:332729-Pleurochrysis_carterae.AAC.1